MKRSSEKNSEKLNKRKRVISAIMVFFMLLVSFTPAGYSIFADESTISQIAPTEAENRTNTVSDESGLDTSVPGDAVTNEASLEHLTLELTQEESDEEGTLHSRVVSEKETLEAQEEVEETSIVLDGMMPKNATATAVDVTAEREKIEAADAEAAAKKNESEKNAVSDASSEVEQSITGNSTSEQNRNAADDTAVTNQSSETVDRSKNQTNSTESGESNNRSDSDAPSRNDDANSNSLKEESTSQASATENVSSTQIDSADDVSVNPVQDTVYQSADVQPVDGAVEYANASQGDAEMQESDGTRNDSADGSAGNEAGQDGSADNTNNASVSNTSEAGNSVDQSGKAGQQGSTDQSASADQSTSTNQSAVADESGTGNNGNNSNNSSTKDASNNGKSQKANEEDDEREIISVLSDGLSILAAYDITILDAGDEEYQPSEKHPITVSIRDARIKEDSKLYLWHIKDDGEKEEIKEFTVTDGELRFDATGFSVYEIVEAYSGYDEGFGWKEANTIDLIKKHGESGFYVSNSDKKYLTGEKTSGVSGNSDRDGLLTTEVGSDSVPVDDIVKFYFEWIPDTENSFYIYKMDGDSKIYLKMTSVSGNNKPRAGITFANGESDRSVFNIINKSGKLKVSSVLRVGNEDITYFWNRNNKTPGSGAIVGYSSENDSNTYLLSLHYNIEMPESDPYNLDGTKHGLINASLSGTTGYALMAKKKDDSMLQSCELKIKKDTVNKTGDVFVAENKDITEWTFHSTTKDNYTLSTVVDGKTMYLQMTSSGLTIAESEPTEFQVVVKDGKIKLCSEGKAVSCDSAKGFKLENDGTAAKFWLSFSVPSMLTEDDFVNYSAVKVGISDVDDGQQVIVYTRVWDDVNKTYEFFAIDHDGTLYPCYERGDNIMWVGNQFNTLLWDFTEYHYDDGSPNYYYELQNTYSEMFLAPQIGGGQTLAATKKGINLPGRKEGEYYSTILAWDKPYYSYAGLKVDENDQLVSCPRGDAGTFYFAIMDTVVPTLNEVTTVDNNQYGITMKMVDFTDRAQQEGVLGDTSGFHQWDRTQGILSTDLKTNGYPDTMINKSLSELYSGAKTVNHLFIESTYNASGYFEYDSCQNFASLKGKTEGDFTVYKEIGTMNTRDSSTDKHGQFMPYNDIYPGEYSSVNPQNLNDIFGNPLPESDPRKYEKLYRVGNANNTDATDWNFGMELNASFVQTPSGKDAWGHDIIFEFTGDDDFWLYVDNELVIDLGGVHSAIPGKVNFATGDVTMRSGGNEIHKTLRQLFKENYEKRNPTATTQQVNEYLANYFDGDDVVFKDYSSHTMKIFYMERGLGASNLHMRFNLSYVTPGHVIFSKEVSGSDDVDFDLVQYPYQIWYKDNLDDNIEYLLTNNGGLISVTYQNSTQTVDYAATYKPPGSTNTYESVYFLYPGKAAEIHFPADTIEYRIVECGLNNEVYDHVYVNDTEIVGTNLPTTTGEDSKRSSFDSGWISVKERPKVTFNNHVDPDGLRTLSFQKKIEDENGIRLDADDDPTVFDFRLYLSNGVDDKLMPANMVKYSVKDAEGYLCRWDAVNEKFDSSEDPDTHQRYRDYSAFTKAPGDSDEEVAAKEALKKKYMFDTSMNGSISQIPPWYTVEVPNLPVGTRFKVEERFSETPVGYGRVEYERAEGGSYIVEDGDTLNSGRIRANESPQMNVKNKRGFGLEADKIWSDKSYTNFHETVYTAVYVDGLGLLDGTVRELKYPDTYVRYFFEEMKPGKTLADYSIYEVLLEGNDLKVDDDGVVTGYTSITRLNEGDETKLLATSKSTGITDEYNYAVTYKKGTPYKSLDSLDHDNIRIDSINNTRTGGVVMSLFDMSDHTKPLAGGVFTLQKYDSVSESYKNLGTFTSDSDGRINILYDFEYDTEYRLTETASPKGYIGAPNTVSFQINDSNEVTVTTLNDDEWQDGGKLSENVEKLVAYVNIYNKPYTLKVYKSDRDTSEDIPEAHFALYRGKTGGQGNVIRDYYPMSGYEDLITDTNGLITAIDNNLPAGTYFIEETQPPTGYSGITGFIEFVISPLGGIEVISSPVNSGVVLESGEGNTGVYIYTLRIPNKRDTAKELTITKTVVGNQGNKAKDFTFTFEVTGDDGTGSEEYSWKKNDVEQTTALKSHGTFTLSHGESVVISVPSDAEVTISESPEDYKPSFKLGTENPVDDSALTFTVTDDVTLSVTNTRDGIIPTGVWLSFKALGALGAACLAGMFYFWRRKRKTEKFLAKVRSGE